MKQKLDEIIKILILLKEYDSHVPKLRDKWNPSLMGLYNDYGRTAYQEFSGKYNNISVEGLINQKLPTYNTELIKLFNHILERPTNSHHPPPPGKAMGGNVLDNL